MADPKDQNQGNTQRIIVPEISEEQKSPQKIELHTASPASVSHENELPLRATGSSPAISPSVPDFSETSSLGIKKIQTRDTQSEIPVQLTEQKPLQENSPTSASSTSANISVSAPGDFSLQIPGDKEKKLVAGAGASLVGGILNQEGQRARALQYIAAKRLEEQTSREKFEEFQGSTRRIRQMEDVRRQVALQESEEERGSEEESSEDETQIREPQYASSAQEKTSEEQSEVTVESASPQQMSPAKKVLIAQALTVGVGTTAVALTATGLAISNSNDTSLLLIKTLALHTIHFLS